MKANKWGIFISLIITIASLLCSIFTKNCCWLNNLSFAILGSAFLSFLICLINFLVLRKELVKSILVEAYKINSFGYSALFSTSKDISLEKTMEVLNIVEDRYYSVYVKTIELNSKFRIGYRKKLVKEIVKIVVRNLEKISEICFFIELYQDIAIDKTQKIYEDLDNLLSDNTIYLKALELANIYGNRIYSLESDANNETNKRKYADAYKNSLK